MILIKFLKSRMQKLSLSDIAFLKLACISFGIMLASIFPEALLRLSWKGWITISIILMLKPFYSFYLKR
ncbi:MAG: hypothetical protein N4A43_01935 [Alphaproteobacteria bacterium]|jgi:hypothetical protein|nr:hypothetical protein [Alphaproteobacteria bacterium]